MNKQEILKNNLLIARSTTDEPEVLERDLQKAGTVESMHYHDDYNWLMPALNKLPISYTIERLTIFTDSSEFKCSLIYYNEKLPTGSKKVIRYSTDPLKAVYKSIVEFLEWYKTK